MPDPTPPPPPPGAEAAPETWIASRLQARFEGLGAEDAAWGAAEPTSGSALQPGAVRTGTADHGYSRSQDRAAQRQIDDLLRQLTVLRDQLDAAFDELDQRVETAETRASVAEARASVAEARASVAETRALDAEARANLAHTRIDEVVAYITQDDLEDDGEQDDEPPAPEPSVPTLRGALDRLRDRLDVG
jgi:chromosome segregation ATPase